MILTALGLQALETLEAQVAQLICPALPRGAALHDPATMQQLLSEQERLGWGGYILFGGDRRRTPPLLSALQTASTVPLLIAADLERGAGQQLAGCSTFPSAMALGAAGDPALAHAVGAVTAAEALRCGVNWVLAPVADVNVDPENPIINIRAFGNDPDRVGELASAFVRGCQEQGALACAKHFPGHGDTREDSHTRLATVRADRARLDAVELAPFRRCLEAGVATLMSAHLAVPALGVKGPATLAPSIMTELLRNELGFEGLAVTDAFTMGGLTQAASQEEAAIQAIAAGCDMLLMPPDPAAVHRALVMAVNEGRLERARVDEATSRVLAAKGRLRRMGSGMLPPPVPDPELLARAIAEASLTMVRKAAGLVPLPGDKRMLHLVVDDGAEPEQIAYWRRLCREAGFGEAQVLCPGAEEAASARLLGEAREVDLVLLSVFSPVRMQKGRAGLPEALATLLAELTRITPTVALSFSSPYLLAQLPEVAAYLLTYGAHAASLQAVLGALSGNRGWPGKLPVSLPVS